MLCIGLCGCQYIYDLQLLPADLRFDGICRLSFCQPLRKYPYRSPSEGLVPSFCSHLSSIRRAVSHTGSGGAEGGPSLQHSQRTQRQPIRWRASIARPIITLPTVPLHLGQLRFPGARRTSPDCLNSASAWKPVESANMRLVKNLPMRNRCTATRLILHMDCLDQQRSSQSL